MRRTGDLVILAMLLCVGVILQAIEAIYLPPLIIPGAKLGLANSITLLVIILFRFWDAIIHVIARVFTVSLVTGTLMSTTFAYSLTGGLLSALVMVVVARYFYGPLSYAGVSLLGALTHNLTQLALAVLILGHIGILTLAPWLMFLAVIAGLPNGLLVNLVEPRLGPIGRELRGV